MSTIHNVARLSDLPLLRQSTGLTIAKNVGGAALGIAAGIKLGHEKADRFGESFDGWVAAGGIFGGIAAAVASIGLNGRSAALTAAGFGASALAFTTFGMVDARDRAEKQAKLKAGIGVIDIAKNANPIAVEPESGAVESLEPGTVLALDPTGATNGVIRAHQVVATYASEADANRAMVTRETQKVTDNDGYYSWARQAVVEIGGQYAVVDVDSTFAYDHDVEHMSPRFADGDIRSFEDNDKVFEFVDDKPVEVVKFNEVDG